MNMEVGTKERRLAFLRRMIWWMPILAFALVTVVAFLLQRLVASDFMTALVNALIPGVFAAVVAAVVVAAAYYLYNRFVA